MKRIIHAQVYRENAFGGTVNTTLCGRISHAADDYNTGDVATCKLCLLIQANPAHWRNHNIIQTKRD